MAQFCQTTGFLSSLLWLQVASRHPSNTNQLASGAELLAAEVLGHQAGFLLTAGAINLSSL